MKTCGSKNKWKWKRVEMNTCGNETMWNENEWKWKHVEMNTSRRRSVFLSRYLFLVSLSSRVRCFFVYIVLSFPLFLNLRMFSFCIWFSPCYFVDVYAIGMHLGCNWDSIEIQLEFNWNSIQIQFVVFSFPLFSNLHCFIVSIGFSSQSMHAQLATTNQDKTRQRSRQTTTTTTTKATTTTTKQVSQHTRANVMTTTCELTWRAILLWRHHRTVVIDAGSHGTGLASYIDI